MFSSPELVGAKELEASDLVTMVELKTLELEASKVGVIDVGEALNKVLDPKVSAE